MQLCCRLCQAVQTWPRHIATCCRPHNVDELTFRVLDKNLGHIINLAEAGPPALLGFLSALAAASVPPHELVVIQRAIRWTFGVAPPACRHAQHLSPTMLLSYSNQRDADCAMTYADLTILLDLPGWPYSLQLESEQMPKKKKPR